MINWISKTIWLVLMMVLAVAGCEQEQQQLQKVDISVEKPPYVSQAIEAAGGTEAWAKTKTLDFDCVVAFYQPDGSFYLTEQHHKIDPLSNLIRLSAQEPQGKFIWELSPAGFTVIEGTKQGDFLPDGLGAEDFAKAILDITTIPVRLIERKTGLIRSAEPVKIEGQWYYPVGRPMSDNPDSETPRANLVYYQNRDNYLVDMLLLTGTDKGASLAVRGYNYHEVEKGGIWVPVKIEIFLSDAGSVMQKRLVKIDYHQSRRAK
ncbi:MAG: hypothetical protein ACYSUY_12545 [Planctomycetota bacterium]|jgi:hypothetical protein